MFKSVALRTSAVAHLWIGEPSSNLNWPKKIILLNRIAFISCSITSWRSWPFLSLNLTIASIASCWYFSLSCKNLIHLFQESPFKFFINTLNPCLLLADHSDPESQFSRSCKKSFSYSNSIFSNLVISFSSSTEKNVGPTDSALNKHILISKPNPAHIAQVRRILISLSLIRR